jgi:uncharacterized protein YegJ (DUF2314 family)
MKLITTLVVIAALSLGNCACAAEPSSIYTNVQGDLNHFNNALAQPAKFGSYRILVELKEGKNREQFWLNRVRRDGNAYIGILETSPRVLSSFKLRHEIRLEAPEILDWNYENRLTRTIYGHYNACVEFKALPAEESTEQITYWRLACAPSD